MKNPSRLSKTELGHRVLKDRSVQLSQPQRAALIMLDGSTSAEQVLAKTAGIGVTPEDIELLLAAGLVQEAGAGAGLAAAGGARTQRPPAQRYADAYPIAARLTASLGLRGFRLNLAIEKAASYEQLRDLSPRILEAVGPEAFAELDRALNA